VSKRSRRARTRPTQKRRPGGRPTPRREEPDLIQQIAAALADDDPLMLLGFASTLLAVLDPRSRNPFEPAPDGPSREVMVDSLLAVPLPETSAVLAAMATMSGDDVLRRRVHRERSGLLPGWLADLHRTTALPRAVELTHVLGDGDNVLVSATLPGGHELTAVVYIDHNMGTLVKDAFVLSMPLDDVVEHLRTAAGDDPDTEARPLDPADARARIVEAVECGAITFPPFETDTWPSCRPLVEWMAGLLPAGGTGYQRPEWDEAATKALAERFLATLPGPDHTTAHDLLSSLLWFGTDYGPGDPMRWSPTAVEILLLDWIPRKIVDDVEVLATVPALLREFIRFCHKERGVRAALTEQTLGAVDGYEPEYQRLIRSDRPQGPAALLAAMGMLDEPEQSLSEYMLDSLRREVGGQAALDALDAQPLPAEPFAWDAVPPDVHARVGEVLEQVERCCTELLDEQYRTVCRRLLADAAAGDPEIFRRRSKAATAAAAICWMAGKANSLFDREPVTPKMAVKDLTGYFGTAGTGVSQRSLPLLRAIGAGQHQYGQVDLGSPRYLTGPRREHILAHRDRYLAMED
jgi:Domain of unknown function (DUF6398)